MKKFSLVLGTFLALFLIACEGPTGVAGANGIDGEDGSIFEAAAFEIEIDFTLNAGTNTYEYGPAEYPSDISLIADDVVLMYRLEEVTDGLDVWRQMPQPFFTDNGLLYYNFDFTVGDYGLYIETEFDSSLAATELIEAQVFRIVVIPANLGTSSKTDMSNMTSVLDALGITEEDISKI